MVSVSNEHDSESLRISLLPIFSAVSGLYVDPLELESVYYSASSKERSMDKTVSVHRKVAI